MEHDMRTPMIAGNWKMNTTIHEATALVKDMKDGLERVTGVEKVLCPPFISLFAVKELVQGTSIKVGAQNMHFEEKGAFTGEVSPLMLSGICDYVILGHSERRQYFGESDDIVNSKMKSALAAGLIPIMCVGERLEENETGKTVDVVTRQVKGGLADIDSPQGIVIAYEPVWAIGTGKAATSEEANATIGVIREVVAGIYDTSVADGVRILYGGSMNAANVAELLQKPEIDGGLVGGASLKAAEFVSMVEQTAAV
jgi:triosephosphate isomerase